MRALTIQPSGEASYSVSVRMALRAADPVDGVLLLEDLLRRLSSQPEVSSGHRPETWALPDELGLMTGDLEFEVELSGRPEPERELPGEYASTEHALRLLARRETARVPGLRLSPKGIWTELAPVRDEHAQVAALHGLLSDVETWAPGTLVRGMQIKPPGTGGEPAAEGPLVDSWTWNATLERRVRDALPVRWSALDGLHLLMGLGDSFARSGVSVGGFRPEYEYGGVRRRELGLGPERQRAIETHAGYSFELRQLQVTLTRMELSLYFEHPDGSVEATRLFETFREALLAQPEVREVSLPQLFLCSGR